MPPQQSWKRIAWRENVLWHAERRAEIITGVWRIARPAHPAIWFSNNWCLYAWNAFPINFAIIDRANQHAGSRCLQVYWHQPQHAVPPYRTG